MKKRTLSVLLTAAMAVTMLAGCGSKKESAPAETAAPAAHFRFRLCCFPLIQQNLCCVHQFCSFFFVLLFVHRFSPFNFKKFNFCCNIKTDSSFDVSVSFIAFLAFSIASCDGN